MQKARLIVGLGNPGKEYEYTRHNIGFLIVQELVKRYGSSLQKKTQLMGDFAKATKGDQTYLFLLPMTYMNLSGRSVRRCIDYYRLMINRLIVIVDDVYLPFGKMRLREEGQSGGHKGLKSIDECLGTNRYARLRVGLGQSKTQNLSDFVIGKFNSDELEKLPKVIDSAAEVVQSWIDFGTKAALETLSKFLSSPDQQDKGSLEEI